MNILAALQSAFHQAISQVFDAQDSPAVEPHDIDDMATLIRPAQDPKFGDYQANMAMAMGKKLGMPPRDVAQQIVEHLSLDEICQPPEIAGPGFINLRLKKDWIGNALLNMLGDERLGVSQVDAPKTVVVDFSSPNVAKPMHVGHIRSTVIGDSLARIHRFLGHHVITDNHLGDWGTQFGMIIYGYKHFVDAKAYETAPVDELGRLYRYVRRLMDFQSAKSSLDKLSTLQEKLQTEIETKQSEAESAEKPQAKKLRKEIGRLQDKRKEALEKHESAVKLIAAVEATPSELADAQAHSAIGEAVLQETASLHAGDKTNRELWEEFLPYCREDIQKIYDQLDISFDHELGESFYHPWLSDVVSDLKVKGLVTESEGAQCVFLDEFDSPMIVQKRDGAFLYATTDLATIQYRMKEWNPDVVLYVVDHRQHEHFSKLFAVAEKWGYDQTEFRHVAFGTVMGPDGKPYKTRSGDTVGLQGLLDEAVASAKRVVDENLEKSKDLNFDEEERSTIAGVVGIGALKYADLSQNRASDYEFSYEKMLALRGNTAPYLLYPYARVNGIFSKGDIDAEALRSETSALSLDSDAEHKLALSLLRFEQSLHDALIDYTPNTLANFLYELTTSFSQFYEKCKVLEAESGEAKSTRLVLCDLVRRTLKTGLDLLGIQVVERM